MERRSLRVLGRRFAAFALVTLTGCSSVPGWLDERISAVSATDGAPVIYPDLADIPAPPGAPPSEEERNSAIEVLEAERSANQSAGQSLDREIENDFEFPASSSN